MSKFINKKSAVVALVATAMLGGGVAFAYPPDQALNVAATASSDGTSAHVLVTVSNANPNCATAIRVTGSSASTVVPATHGGTTVTTTFDIPGLSGRHSVTARTQHCAKGSKEHAKSKFVVLTTGNHVSYPATAKVRSNYKIYFSGLVPSTTNVSVIGTGPEGKQVSDGATVNRRGEATLKLKFKKAGTWTLVTTITTADGGSTTSSKIVDVQS